jgi:hypothetical protein
MDQPAKNLAASYPRHRQVSHRGRSGVFCVRWPQVPGPVRAMLVIVHDVLVQNCPQVPLPGDQHPAHKIALATAMIGADATIIAALIGSSGNTSNIRQTGNNGNVCVNSQCTQGQP